MNLNKLLEIEQSDWSRAISSKRDFGRFPLTKITGSNFRNFRWSNGTCPTASQNSKSRALQHKECWVELCCV